MAVGEVAVATRSEGTAGGTEEVVAFTTLVKGDAPPLFTARIR